MLLPASRFNSGLGSKLSKWLTPPRINSPDNAFGSGGKMRLFLFCIGSIICHEIAPASFLLEKALEGDTTYPQTGG